MSLFPAYFINTSSSATREADQKPDDNSCWQANKSFSAFASNELHLPGNSKNDDTSVEITATTWIKDVHKSAEKKKLKNKHKKERKQLNKKKINKRNKTTKQVELQAFRNGPFISNATGKCNTFAQDCNRELENLQFGSLYQKYVASYKYVQNGCCLFAKDNNFALLAVKQLFPTKNIEKQFTNRYFSRKVLMKKDSLLRIIANKKPMSLNNVQFIPLSSVGDCNVFQEITHESNNDIIGTLRDNCFSDEITIENDELLRNQSYLNRLCNENPKSVHLWLKLVQFQDNFLDCSLDFNNEHRRMTRLALLERKMSIIEKAIVNNSDSILLQLLRMNIADEFWTREKLRTEWQRLEFLMVNQPQMWIGQIQFYMSSLSGFSVSKIIKLFAKCLEKINIVLSGSLLTHPPLPYTKHFLLQVIFWRAYFLLASGHAERALASLQSVIEFNFCIPPQIFSTDIEQKKAFFEPFWDRSAPKFGQNNSKSWRDVFINNSEDDVVIVDDTEKVYGKLEEQLCTSSKNVADFQLWLLLERLRWDHHWAPWSVSGQEPEDIERLVHFDDIYDCLVQFDSTYLKVTLLIEFLKFLGAPIFEIYCQSAQTELFELCGRRFSDKLLIGYPIIDTINKMPFDACVMLTRNTIDFAIQSTEGSYRLYFYALRLFCEAIWLKENLSLSDKDRINDLKKIAKGLIAKNCDESNTCILYATLAKCFQRFGENVASQESLKIIRHTLKQFSETDLFAQPVNSVVSSVVLRLLYMYSMHLMGYYDDNSRNIAVCIDLLSKFFCSNYLDRAYLEQDVVQLEKSNITTTRQLAKKLLLEKLDTLEIWVIELSDDESAFLFAWLGSSYVLLARLCMLYAVACGDFEQMLTLFHKAVNACEMRKSKFGVDSISASLAHPHYLSASKDVDRLIETLIISFEFQLSLRSTFSYSLSQKRLRDDLRMLVEQYPTNGDLLHVFCNLHISGQLITELRRYFSTVAISDDCSSAWWIAVIDAELQRYKNLKRQLELQTTPNAASFKAFGELHRIRRLFRRALEHRNCAHIAELWRVFLEFELVEANSIDQAQKVLVTAIRQCPWAKDLYLDAIKYWPDHFEQYVDMMFEKELRVRIDKSELDLLRENLTN